jgi:hypothetical protein
MTHVDNGLISTPIWRVLHQKIRLIHSLFYDRNFLRNFDSHHAIIFVLLDPLSFQNVRGLRCHCPPMFEAFGCLVCRFQPQ